MADDRLKVSVECWPHWLLRDVIKSMWAALEIKKQIVVTTRLILTFVEKPCSIVSRSRIIFNPTWACLSFNFFGVFSVH